MMMRGVRGAITVDEDSAELIWQGARDMGWTQTALMGMQEMDVPHGLKLCIRVLIHWNTDKRQDELQHVFLRGAVVLRPDLSTDQKNIMNGRS